jgi:hypothetical protein
MPSSQSLIKASSVLGVTVIIFLLDWFYLTYVTLHGLQPKTQVILIGTMNLSLPLEWLPIVGVVLLSLVLWYEESARIFPKRGTQIDTLANLRLLRLITLSLTIFVFILYVPNVVGSNWFWGVMSGISELHGIASYLLATEQSFMSLDPVWVYSLSQVLASTGMVVSAWLIGGLGTRRPRR